MTLTIENTKQQIIKITLNKLMQNNNPRIILDNGGHSIKFGLASDQHPQSLLSVVGIPKYMNLMIGMMNQRQFVGDQAIQRRGVLSLRYPIQNGHIINYDYIRKLWNHCFYNELRQDPSECSILMTESSKAEREQREKVIEDIFDCWNFEKFYLASAPVLSLISAGKTAGLVVNHGEGSASAVPIFEGSIMSHAIENNSLSGKELTEEIQKILEKFNDFGENKFIARDLAPKIKQTCSVSLQPHKKSNNNNIKGEKIQFLLPDGEIVSLDSRTEFESVTEKLFESDQKNRSLQQIITASISASDVDLRRTLYSNIVLAGGSTLIGNYRERLARELKIEMKRIQTPANYEEDIVAPENRLISAWLGGTILSSMPSFQQKWILRNQYQEWGPEIIHRRCF